MLADRVLPSREKFNEQYPDDWPEGWRDVLDAYASGRLVDREAIDYEAAGAVMEDWAEYLEDKAGRWAATVEAVDAALPDQEV